MYNILIVDDEKGILYILKQTFQLLNYNVHIAFNGKQAIDILSNKFIDLIITDIDMPEMNGIQLLQYIKEKYNDEKEVILMSGGCITFRNKQIINKHHHYFFHKPFNLNVMVNLVKELLSKKDGEQNI